MQVTVWHNVWVARSVRSRGYSQRFEANPTKRIRFKLLHARALQRERGSSECGLGAETSGPPAARLQVGSTPAEAAHRVGEFLGQRRWLRPRPDAPLQLVCVPASQLPAACRSEHKPTNAALPRLQSELVFRLGSEDSAGTAQDDLQGNRAATGGISPGSVSTIACPFFLVRDDLLHPLLGGNKIRKLDGLIPELLAEGATDVVTCGGVQSAHTAAVAVAAAEAGLRSHLLVRGERPQVPSGYHLVTRMYGSEVSYVSRAEYADRAAMLASRVESLRNREPNAQVAVVAEGGGDAAALLGLLRLVHWLATAGIAGGEGGAAAGGLGGPVHQRQRPRTRCQAQQRDVESGSWRSGPSHVPSGSGANREEEEEELGEGDDSGPGSGALQSQVGPRAPLPARVMAVQGLPDPTSTPYNIVVDSGTGTTAIGLALAIALLGLPWSVSAVMLAGDLPYYTAQQEQLVGSFLQRYGTVLYGDTGHGEHGEESGGRDTAAAALGVGHRPVNETKAQERAAAVATVPWRLPPGPGTPPPALRLEWVPRAVPRRFGWVLGGEIATCKEVAREYGIGLDPIYSLAAWELACSKAATDAAAAAADETSAKSPAGTDAVAGYHTAAAGNDRGLHLRSTSAAGVNASSLAGDARCPVSAVVAPGGEPDLAQLARLPALGGDSTGCTGLGEGSWVVQASAGAAEGAGGQGPANSGTAPAAPSASGVASGGRARSDQWVSEGPWAATRARVVMLHGGGELGLHGLAQRFPEEF